VRIPEATYVGGEAIDDTEVLIKLNLQFIEAFRKGSWELLEPILSPSFSYLDGATGEVWAHERYVENLRSHAAPALTIDQVRWTWTAHRRRLGSHVEQTGRAYSRYVDTYERRGDDWLCIHTSVWPLRTNA
jgi:hypothetical protein